MVLLLESRAQLRVQLDVVGEELGDLRPLRRRRALVVGHGDAERVGVVDPEIPLPAQHVAQQSHRLRQHLEHAHPLVFDRNLPAAQFVGEPAAVVVPARRARSQLSPPRKRANSARWTAPSAQLRDARPVEIAQPSGGAGRPCCRQRQCFLYACSAKNRAVGRARGAAAARAASGARRGSCARARRPCVARRGGGSAQRAAPTRGCRCARRAPPAAAARSARCAGRPSGGRRGRSRRGLRRSSRGGNAALRFRARRVGFASEVPPAFGRCVKTRSSRDA